MNVVRLYRELQNAKPRSRGSGQSPTDRQKHALLSHARQEPRTPQGDVNRMPVAMQRPTTVRNANSRNFPLDPSTRVRKWQRELLSFAQWLRIHNTSIRCLQ